MDAYKLLDGALSEVNINPSRDSIVRHTLNKEQRAAIIAAVMPIVEKLTKGEQQQ